MASWRSSGAGTVVRVLTIGVCAIPLAAGYADAHGIDRSRPAGTSSPERPSRAAPPYKPGSASPAGSPSVRNASPAGRPSPRQALAEGRLCTAAGQRRPSAVRRAPPNPQLSPVSGSAGGQPLPSGRPSRNGRSRAGRGPSGTDDPRMGVLHMPRTPRARMALAKRVRMARAKRLMPRARIPQAGFRSRGRCRAGVAAAPATRAGIEELLRVRPANGSRRRRAQASRLPRPQRAQAPRLPIPRHERGKHAHGIQLAGRPRSGRFHAGRVPGSRALRRCRSRVRAREQHQPASGFSSARTPPRRPRGEGEPQLVASRQPAHGRCSGGGRRAGRLQTGRFVLGHAGVASSRRVARLEQSPAEPRRTHTPADTRSGLEQADHHRAAPAGRLVWRPRSPGRGARSPARGSARDAPARRGRDAGCARARGTRPPGRSGGVRRLPARGGPRGGRRLLRPVRPRAGEGRDHARRRLRTWA